MAQPPPGTIARFLVDQAYHGRTEITDADIDAAELDDEKKKILKSKNFDEVRREVEKEAAEKGAQPWFIAPHPEAWLMSWFR